MDASKQTVFNRPRCAECGKELEPEPAAYQSRRRLYCQDCLPINKLKESWLPMSSGSAVAGIFILHPKKTDDRR